MPPVPCSRCGATIAANFCPQCGAAVDAGASRGRRGVVLGAVGLGVAVGLGTWSMVHGDTAHGDANGSTGSAEWESDWRAGVAGLKLARDEQKTSQKPMLLYFYADWCGYCRRLESTVLSTAEGRSALRGVILVRINAESGRDEQQLAGQMNIRGYPTLILFTPDGNAKRIRTPQSPDELRRVLG